MKQPVIGQLALDSLYAGQVPHEVKSPTSRKAAESLSPKRRATLHALVLDAIYRAGWVGMTDDELQVRLGRRSQTQSPRRRELELVGLVEDSERERKTRLGGVATVWIISEAGGAMWRQACGWLPHGKPADADGLQRLTKSISVLRKGQARRAPHQHLWQWVAHPNLYTPAPCPKCRWAWLPGVIAPGPVRLNGAAEANEACPELVSREGNTDAP